MTISEKTYQTTPGSSAIMRPTLIYKNIIVVHREGVEYDLRKLFGLVVSSPALTRQVFFYPAKGLLKFKDDMPFNDGETVNVIFAQ